MFSDLLIGINSLDAPAIAAAYTFTKSSHIADIGGGTGCILATILANHPFVKWCRLRDSNPRPTVYKTVALPLC